MATLDLRSAPVAHTSPRWSRRRRVVVHRPPSSALLESFAAKLTRRQVLGAAMADRAHPKHRTANDCDGRSVPPTHVFSARRRRSGRRCSGDVFPDPSRIDIQFVVVPAEVDAAGRFPSLLPVLEV